jgi:tetratricopeptide (TPR) repeat protein
MSIELVRKLRRSGNHEKALEVILPLVTSQPSDATLQFEAACLHDYLGLEADAIPYYVASIAGTLDRDSLRSAYLGLGSTYRAMGRYEDAERTLREGLSIVPGANELKIFLAMVLHNLGRSSESVELLLRVIAKTSRDKKVSSYRKAVQSYSQESVESLLRVIAKTSRDKTVMSYRKAILFYAQDIDRCWH